MYDDFTEATYRRLIDDVRLNYRFGSFLNPPDDPHVLWRHDIDLSPHRALSLAQIEADAGVRATYFIRIHSPFYNVLERPVAKILHKISILHEVGLHAEPKSPSRIHVGAEVEWGVTVLQNIVASPVLAINFHNPTVADLLQYDDDMIEGFVNAQSARFMRDYTYVSDSGGSWRSPIHELIDPAAHPRLHVATHPEWWTEIAMNPDQRIYRGIQGRARASRLIYEDEINARFGALSR